MDQSLRDAALQGNIDALYALMEKDPAVLDRIDQISFVETPLHTAASAGHIQFAMEIMRLKPSFARKLDKDGFTPMHIALQKYYALDQNNEIDRLRKRLQRNQALLVNQLLSVDKDLVRVQGRKGLTPLHYAAETEALYFLDKFFKVCPESFEDVTNLGENVMHIALKNDKIGAFKHMLRMVQRTRFKYALLMEKKLLRWQDAEDNTLLHVAVSRNQTEVVSLLLERGLVDLDAKNLAGKTVFMIAQRQAQAQVDNKGTMNLLYRRGRKCLTARPIEMIEKWYVGMRRRQIMMTDERLNALLVVAALILTVTYQAALSPPGANQCNCTAPSGEVNPSPDLVINIFLFLNTLTYCLTNAVLFLLIRPDFFGSVLKALLLSLFACFFVSVLSINAPPMSLSVKWSSLAVLITFLILRAFRWLLAKLRKYRGPEFIRRFLDAKYAIFGDGDDDD